MKKCFKRDIHEARHFHVSHYRGVLLESFSSDSSPVASLGETRETRAGHKHGTRTQRRATEGSARDDGKEEKERERLPIAPCASLGRAQKDFLGPLLGLN